MNQPTVSGTDPLRSPAAEQSAATQGAANSTPQLGHDSVATLTAEEKEEIVWGGGSGIEIAEHNLPPGIAASLIPAFRSRVECALYYRECGKTPAPKSGMLGVALDIVRRRAEQRPFVKGLQILENQDGVWVATREFWI